MSAGSASSTDIAQGSPARLRLVRGEGASWLEAERGPDEGTTAVPGTGRFATLTADARSGPYMTMTTNAAGPAGSVLVAGSDQRKRAEMLEELRGLLPAETRFVEARETWEVVALAPDSRMVLLMGDVGEISAGALMRVLSRRHPTLPVIALGSRPCAGAPSHAGVA